MNDRLSLNTLNFLCHLTLGEEAPAPAVDIQTFRDGLSRLLPNERDPEIICPLSFFLQKDAYEKIEDLLREAQSRSGLVISDGRLSKSPSELQSAQPTNASISVSSSTTNTTTTEIVGNTLYQEAKAILTPRFSGIHLFTSFVTTSDVEFQLDKKYRDYLSAFVGEVPRDRIAQLKSAKIDDLQHVVHPAPPIAALAEDLAHGPIILLWTRTGGHALIKLTDVKRGADALKNIITSATSPFVVDEFFRSIVKEKKHVGVLQISDLHFGHATVHDYTSVIKSNVRSRLAEFDHLVISGDVVNSPNAKWTSQFRAFKRDLQDIVEHRPITVIAGNHDVRKSGFLWSSYSAFPALGHKAVAIDAKNRIVMLCFDSSENGRMAAGYVSVQQRHRVQDEYEAAVAQSPEVKNYFHVGLIHHHCVDLSEAMVENQWLRLLPRQIVPSSEMNIGLSNRDEVLSWFARWGVRLVMFGHTHKAWHIKKAVKYDSAQASMSLIGCGSTFGIGNEDLRFNMFRFDALSKSWSNQFFRASREGGPFQIEEMAIIKK